MPVTSALRSQKEENQKFKFILCYPWVLKLVWAKRDPISKPKAKQPKRKRMVFMVMERGTFKEP